MSTKVAKLDKWLKQDDAAELAEKQLYDIKNILTSKFYLRYFPDMVNPEEGNVAPSGD